MYSLDLLFLGGIVLFALLLLILWLTWKEPEEEDRDEKLASYNQKRNWLLVGLVASVGAYVVSMSKNKYATENPFIEILDGEPVLKSFPPPNSRISEQPVQSDQPLAVVEESETQEK